MRFDDVLSEISAFWTDGPLPLTGGGGGEIGRIQAEFAQPLPDELKEYITRVLPPEHLHLEQYGIFSTIYGFRQLSSRQDSYSWDPAKGQPFPDWRPEWFLIGDQEADPLIVDLGQVRSAADPCPVLVAPHGAGKWRFKQISSSLPQFLLCAAYMHHALFCIVPGETTTSRNRILRRPQIVLADEVAAWLLPRIKRCDPAFYKSWVGIFDNA